VPWRPTIENEIQAWLSQPALRRGVNEDQVAPGALESVDRALPAVRGAVIDDHGHALRPAVGRGCSGTPRRADRIVRSRPLGAQRSKIPARSTPQPAR